MKKVIDFFSERVTGILAAGLWLAVCFAVYRIEQTVYGGIIGNGFESVLILPPIYYIAWLFESEPRRQRDRSRLLHLSGWKAKLGWSACLILGGGMIVYNPALILGWLVTAVVLGAPLCRLIFTLRLPFYHDRLSDFTFIIFSLALMFTINLPALSRVNTVEQTSRRLL